jgi:prepilin-type N-terminal cleavage/methylation domain-containing protein
LIPSTSFKNDLLRRGFTVVELLVVMGIMAALISILLPALAKARFQAILTSCASNERQLGAAMLMYGNDNLGYLPRFDLPTGYGAGNLSDLLGGPIGTPNGFYGYFNFIYKMPQPVFFCPAGNTDTYNLIFTEYNTGTFPMQAISYAVWVPHLSDGVEVPPVYYNYPPRIFCNMVGHGPARSPLQWRGSGNQRRRGNGDWPAAGAVILGGDPIDRRVDVWIRGDGVGHVIDPTAGGVAAGCIR